MSRMTTADLLKLPRGAEALGLVTAPTQEPRRGRMNKWEASFEREWLRPLMLNATAEGAGYRFEPLTFTLYDGSSDVRKSRFTPDFVVWNGSKIMALEVKGRRTAAGIVRLKSAAQQYPWIRFGLATGGPGRWEIAWL